MRSWTLSALKVSQTSVRRSISRSELLRIRSRSRSAASRTLRFWSAFAPSSSRAARSASSLTVRSLSWVSRRFSSRSRSRATLPSSEDRSRWRASSSTAVIM